MSVFELNLACPADVQPACKGLLIYTGKSLDENRHIHKCSVCSAGFCSSAIYPSINYEPVENERYENQVS